MILTRLLRRLDRARYAAVARLRLSRTDEERQLLFLATLASQHYVAGETEAFRATLEATRSRSTVEIGATASELLVLEALAANLDLAEAQSPKRNGGPDELKRAADKAAAAARAYETLIHRVEASHENLVNGRASAGERRYEAYYKSLLAILHGNLAKAATLAGDVRYVERILVRGIRFQPSFVFLREQLAELYMAQKQWEMARQAFEAAFQCNVTKDAESRFRDNLANLNFQRAAALEQEGKILEAIASLEDSAKELQKHERWAWHGKTQFVLGSLLRGQRRFADAIAALTTGAESYEKAGDIRSASYLFEVQGDIEAGRSNWQSAVAAFRRALAVIGNKPAGQDATDRLVGTHAKIGAVSLRTGDEEQGRRAINEACRIWQGKGFWGPYEQIVTDAKELLERPDIAVPLKLHLEQRLGESPPPEEARQLIDGLRGLYRLSGQTVSEDQDIKWPVAVGAVGAMNVAVPLVVELDPGLLTDEAEDHIINAYAPTMRRRVQERYGVKVPGIRLREGDIAHTPSSYVLMIHEVPRAHGHFDPSHRLYVGSKVRLEAAGITGELNTNPADDDEAYWISNTEWQRAKEAGLELWDSFEYPIRRLEALVVANLIEFVGHQEVQNMLEEKKVVQNYTEDIVAKEHFGNMDPFSALIRSLVDERVPVIDVPAIYEVFASRWTAATPPWRVTEEVRLLPQIRPRLWGNNSSHDFFWLMPGSEARLSSDASAVLRSVREAVGGARRPALVVRRGASRPVLRRLLRDWLPAVPVLSSVELQPGLGDRVEGFIDLE